MRIRTVVLAAALALVPLATAWSEGEPWENEQAWKVLLRQEMKVLRGLLQTALKKDYRRQAWYLADRIVQIEPANAEATAIIDKWTGEELQAGQVPKKAWLKKRDGQLRKMGDDYFHFGEILEASGMDPLKYYPINVRAHAYGSQAGNLLTALRQANYVWLGVYGPKPQDEIDKCLQGPLGAFEFPEEFHDEYLKARAVWPDARGARYGSWRLLTDHDYKETLRLLDSLAAAESWLMKHLGSKAKKNDETVTNLMVFSEWQAYDKIGGDLIREADKARFKDTSGWHDRFTNRLMVCWRHRVNSYLGDDDLMLGHAAKVMARRHLASGAGGEVQGRGYWLLEGLRGAFEGFRRDDKGKGEIDPGSCWRLAAARALRDEGKLIPWKEFFQLNQREGEAKERPDIKISFGGSGRDAKQVDVVAAQATALVVGILKADRGKSRRKLGKLIGDLYKRDSLPDVDKTLGLKPGKAVAMAEIAMDAAHGLKPK